MLSEPLQDKIESTPLLFLRHNWLFVAGTFLLLLVNAWLLANSQQGDALIAINKLRSPFWDVFFKIGTHFAEPVAYFGVLVIVTAFSFRKGLFIIFTGVAAGIVSGILKYLFAQPRPLRWFFDNYEEIWHSLNQFEEEWRSWDPYSSFPSGHSVSAFALYGFLAFSVRRGKFAVSLFCFYLAVMVGFSRMYLLFHFLRDVTVGAGIGLCLAIAMYYLQRRMPPTLFGQDKGWLSYFDRFPAVRRSIPPPE
jgi:membrane-associated phospholipid phosphatase